MSGFAGCSEPSTAPAPSEDFWSKFSEKHSAWLEPNAPAMSYDLMIQGKRVQKDFDIVRETGKPRSTVIKEFRKISADGYVTVAFNPVHTGKGYNPVISGIEIIAENR